MNGRFASALDRPFGFCYRYSQGRKAEPCFPASFDLIVLRSFGVYTQFGIDPFFISTELGLSWLTIPIVAMLPMGFVFADDKQSGYVNLVYD